MEFGIFTTLEVEETWPVRHSENNENNRPRYHKLITNPIGNKLRVCVEGYHQVGCATLVFVFVFGIEPSRVHAVRPS